MPVLNMLFINRTQIFDGVGKKIFALRSTILPNFFYRLSKNIGGLTLPQYVTALVSPGWRILLAMMVDAVSIKEVEKPIQSKNRILKAW